VLATDGCYLGVEGEVPTRVSCPSTFREQLRVLRARIKDPQAGLAMRFSRAVSAWSNEEGGSNTFECVTTRTNLPRQKTGRPQGRRFSAKNRTQCCAYLCCGISSRWA